jgi:hypothetical protein
MATGKEKDKDRGNEHLALNPPPIVSQEQWEAARGQMLMKEKAFTRLRDALAAAPGDAQPARYVRGPPSVDRLSRLLRTGGVRLARARLPWLLTGR